MTGNATKDWAEAHWAPLTGENTELTQFNIWHHRRFGYVDHRDAACGNRWVSWQASREALLKKQAREQEEFIAHLADFEHEDTLHG